MSDLGFFSRSGYLSWRYDDVSSRLAAGAESIEPQDIIASIIRDDRELLATLLVEHGDFLSAAPLVDVAMSRELDKINLNANWSSPSGLRRARASYNFLRRGVIIALGSENAADRLRSFLPMLKAPVSDPSSDVPRHLQAAFGNLNQMVDRVDELYSRDQSSLRKLKEQGRGEMEKLRMGIYDILCPVTDLEHISLSTVGLPFVVLPPGKNPGQFFAGLQSSTGSGEHVLDDGRQRLLENLRDIFGSTRCTFYQGVFRSDEEQNDYIVLAIADVDGSEHAVAISPWRGAHATFVVRSDCGSGLPWPDVLSKSKSVAKDLGARRLVFTTAANSGLNQYDAMRQKILCLLEATPHAFERGKLYFDPIVANYALRDLDGTGRAKAASLLPLHTSYCVNEDHVGVPVSARRMPSTASRPNSHQAPAELIKISSLWLLFRNMPFLYFDKKRRARTHTDRYSFVADTRSEFHLVEFETKDIPTVSEIEFLATKFGKSLAVACLHSSVVLTADDQLASAVRAAQKCDMKFLLVVTPDDFARLEAPSVPGLRVHIKRFRKLESFLWRVH